MYIALKNQEACKLAPYLYLNMAYSFLFDTCLQGATYQSLQLYGIGVLVVGYIIQLWDNITYKPEA